MSVPRFDIFSGFLKTGALWIGSAENLTTAVQLMKERANLRPGPYFVFDILNQKTVASTNTSSACFKRAG
jgi:hypothetical protein